MDETALYTDRFSRRALMANSAPPPLFDGTPERVDAGWHVYQNNIFHSLTEALKASFPVVAALVSEVFFDACARLYIEEAPPVGPVLAEYGATFPEFLADFPPAQSLAYLSDVARLEWAMLEALHGPEAIPLNIENAEMSENACFCLHPTLHVIGSAYPVATIWKAHQASEVGSIDLSIGAETVLVARPDDDVLMMTVTPAEEEFLETLGEGKPIGVAYECATGAADEFNLTSCLSRLFEFGLFVASPDLVSPA